MSTHIDLRMEEPLSYADEYDDNVERDITLARTVSWIGEAEAHAAGVRAGGFLDEFLPASGVGGGGAGSRPDSSPSASGVPSSPDPAGRPHDRPAGDGGDESEAAA